MFDNVDKNCPVVGLLRSRDALRSAGDEAFALRCEEVAWRLWEVRAKREQEAREQARRARGEPYRREDGVLVCPTRIAAGAFDAPPQIGTRAVSSRASQ